MGAAHRRRRVRVAQQRADRDVVLDAERRKRTHDLEGAADAAAAHFVGRQPVDARALECDAARVRREHAGDQIEQRGLAGAVRADHREDRALRHGKADVGDRAQAR